MENINRGELNRRAVSIASGLAIGDFALCSQTSAITMQYNNVNYTNSFADNKFIDGKKLIAHLIKEKNINIEFFLRGPGKTEELKRAISKDILPLYVSIDDEVRVLNVTVENITFNNDGLHTNIQSGNLSLIAVDPPVFYTYNLTSKYYQSITSSFNGEIANLGTFPTYPAYYFVINSAVGLDELKRKVRGYEITINHELEEGDVLIINSDIYGIEGEAGVYLNEVPIEYEGQLTTNITTGSNLIEFTGNGTYDIDITVLYHKLWS